MKFIYFLLLLILILPFTLSDSLFVNTHQSINSFSHFFLPNTFTHSTFVPIPSYSSLTNLSINITEINNNYTYDNFSDSSINHDLYNLTHYIQGSLSNGTILEFDNMLQLYAQGNGGQRGRSRIILKGIIDKLIFGFNGLLMKNVSAGTASIEFYVYNKSYCNPSTASCPDSPKLIKSLVAHNNENITYINQLYRLEITSDGNASLYNNSGFIIGSKDVSEFKKPYFGILVDGNSATGGNASAIINITFFNASSNIKDLNITLNNVLLFNTQNFSSTKTSFNLDLIPSVYPTYPNLSFITTSVGILNFTFSNLTYTFGLDNCSSYNYTTFNWSFYRSPTIRTTADDKVNVSCTFNDTDSINFTTYNFIRYSNSICSLGNISSLSCTGNIKYTGTWTDGYIYTYPFTALPLSYNVTYLNLTVPKLFLNFSSSTDITVLDSNYTYYFDSTDKLIAMSNLSIGKVSILFNDGTQYFEFDNTQNAYYDRSLDIISSADYFVTFSARDTTNTILRDTIINIYETDSTSNTTNLVSRLYKNSEKKVKLNSNNTYLIRAYLSGYAQDNYFESFKPSSLEGDDVFVIMKPDTSIDHVTFQSSHPSKLLSTASYHISITTTGDTTIDYVTYSWTFNGTAPITTTYNSIETETESKWFLPTHGNLTVVVTTPFKSKTFFFEHQTRETRYEPTYYQILLTSKLTFFILFFILIGISISVFKKFKNYAIESVLVIASLFSFINLWMLLISIPLLLGFIIKKNISEEE